MMKDILAAITFVATGLLILVAQAGKPSDGPSLGSFYSEVDREAAETVVVKYHFPVVPEDLELKPLVSRDS